MTTTTIDQIEDGQTVNYCSHLVEVSKSGSGVSLKYLGIYNNNFPHLLTENLIGIK